ncbi:MAG: phospholipase D-like domain-containing protein [Thermoplasmata archaeon]
MSIRPSVLISEFYPRALCSDEYLVIASTSQTPICLANWSISDMEGTLRFAVDRTLEPGDSLVIAMNQSSYVLAYDTMPDISLDADHGRGLAVVGNFRLADVGDSIALISDSGETVDYVLYGSSEELSPYWRGTAIAAPRSGEVVKRTEKSGMLQDSDRATDWYHFREFKYGYTELGASSFAVQPGCVTAFASPDCSLDVVIGAVLEARESVLLCSYELSSVPVASALLDALARNVRVEVLVDGEPAGGMDAEEIACLSRMAAAGAGVSTVNGNVAAKIVQHIGALHAKYMVVDQRLAVVMSENFVESGLPTDRLLGNRGWGVRIDDVGVAAYLSRLFWGDARQSRRDVFRWAEDPRHNASACLPEAVPPGHAIGVLRPLTTTTGCIVTLLPSPDCSAQEPFLTKYLESSAAILAEQFQADLFWKTRWSEVVTMNPIAASLLSGIRNGSQTRVLLDSSWFNLERNNEFAAGLNTDPRGEFRLMDNRSPITVLHNKGAVLNNELTLISSNNWCFSSFAENRELAVLVDSPEVAVYFMKAFYLDWEPDDVPPVADAGEDITAALGDRVALSGRGSTDNRVIASWLWDVGCDGTVEGYGEAFQFTLGSLGRCRVLLTVKDAWGNAATDEVIIQVKHAGYTEGPGEPRQGTSPLWSVPLGLGIGLYLARAAFWRRVVRRASKVNHPPDAFH